MAGVGVGSEDTLLSLRADDEIDCERPRRVEPAWCKQVWLLPRIRALDTGLD